MHDPAMIKSNYDRNPGDQYWTEPWVTQALIECFPWFNRPGCKVWEPACGAGHMANALVDSGVNVTQASDIDINVIGDIRPGVWVTEIDFLYSDFGHLCPGPCNTIITNPPFNLHESFLRQALSFRDIHTVCFLLRSDFKHAKKRIDLFEDPRFSCEIVLTSRPRWDDWWNGKPPKASPRHNYSWFVWDRESEFDNPTMVWHRRNK
jgi:hypothetical protein